MVRTTTPTKPFSTKGTTFTGSQNPGPSRIGRVPSTCSSTFWKPRDGDDIPSDDSDPGERGSPFGNRQRTRVRKRRGTRTGSIVTSGKPWTSHLSSRAEFGASNDANISLGVSTTAVTNGKDSNIISNKLELSSVTSPKITHRKLSSQSPQNRNGDLSINQRKTNKEAQVLVPDNAKLPFLANALIAGANRLAEASHQISLSTSPINSYSDVKDWVFYTVWYPAWDIIWKCDNGRLPLMENHDFSKLIKDILFGNAGPDLEGSYDLNVLKVQNVQTVDDKYRIIGTVELAHRKTKTIKWKPAPIIVGQLLKVVMSTGDIIVQCVPRSSELGGCERKICFIHITFKDGDKVDFCNLFSAVNVQMLLYQIKYEHYVPKIVKCLPFVRKPTVRSGDEQAIPLAITNGSEVMNTLPTITSVSPAVSDRISSNKDSTKGSEAETSNENNVAALESQVVNEVENAQVDDMELCDSESNDILEATSSSSNVLPCRKEKQSTFDLETFIKHGDFIPGPLRPKVKKTERNVYVYNTLGELSTMLTQSISEDVSKNVVPNMMIKHQCHAYGVVDEIVPQFRHENAYYVRVSDETMNSVLLRIHTNSNERNTGPVVDTGKIIRIHRLTVQMEWDAGVGDNTIVLSTPSHRNYVLFEQSSEENQFYYNSCAKSISLDERDMKRVGELHLFKSERSSTRNDEAPAIVEPNIINDRDRDSNLPLPLRSASSVRDCDVDANMLDCLNTTSFLGSQSQGICASDLASPPLTCESNIRECLDYSIRSDESYFSTTSQLQDNQHNAARFSGHVNQVHNVSEADSDELEQMSTSLNVCFTLFKDLMKTDTPLNLLCQIITLCGSSNKNIYRAVIKDIEETVAPDEFKYGQQSMANLRILDEYLVLTITHAKKFEARDAFSLILNGQGTDDVYSIENVLIFGDTPPYELVVDGSASRITRYPYITRDDQTENTSDSEAMQVQNFNNNDGCGTEITNDLPCQT